MRPRSRRRRTPSFVHTLVASLRHGHRDFNLLSSALKLLGSTNVEVTGVLAELLRDPDPDLRIQAALALGAQQDRHRDYAVATRARRSGGQRPLPGDRVAGTPQGRRGAGAIC